MDAADYSVGDYGSTHGTWNYLVYGYLANDMHLKASALILHKVNRTSYLGALFFIYNKFNEPKFGPVKSCKYHFFVLFSIP